MSLVKPSWLVFVAGPCACCASERVEVDSSRRARSEERKGMGDAVDSRRGDIPMSARGRKKVIV
jgi:hypothetical protein